MSPYNKKAKITKNKKKLLSNRGSKLVTPTKHTLYNDDLRKQLESSDESKKKDDYKIETDEETVFITTKKNEEYTVGKRFVEPLGIDLNDIFVPVFLQSGDQNKFVKQDKLMKKSEIKCNTVATASALKKCWPHGMRRVRIDEPIKLDEVPAPNAVHQTTEKTRSLDQNVVMRSQPRLKQRKFYTRPIKQTKPKAKNNSKDKNGTSKRSKSEDTLKCTKQDNVESQILTTKVKLCAERASQKKTAHEQCETCELNLLVSEKLETLASSNSAEVDQKPTKLATDMISVVSPRLASTRPKPAELVMDSSEDSIEMKQIIALQQYEVEHIELPDAQIAQFLPRPTVGVCDSMDLAQYIFPSEKDVARNFRNMLFARKPAHIKLLQNAEDKSALSRLQHEVSTLYERLRMEGTIKHDEPLVCSDNSTENNCDANNPRNPEHNNSHVLQLAETFCLMCMMFLVFFILLCIGETQNQSHTVMDVFHNLFDLIVHILEHIF